MKKTFMILMAVLLLGRSYAQDSALTLKRADSTVLGKAVLDFAVPDIPAFKALGIDASNILRPSSAKELGVAFSNLAKGDVSVIPRNVAIEVAPILFIKPWYTLEQYRTKAGLRILNATRISLGTNEDAETGVNSVAIGLRTTLFDKGDFRSDAAFQQKHIYDKMGAIQQQMAERRRTVIRN